MSFEREFMGLLCLAIVWVNTLLICAQALSELWQRVRLLLQLGPASAGGIGTVRGELGDCQAPPKFELTQVARTRGDGKIYFHDRAVSSTSGPFALVSQDGVITSVVPEGGQTWVWPSRSRVRASLQCPSLEAFDALVPAAAMARGQERRLEFDLAEGQPIYVAGRLSADGSRIDPADFAPLHLRDSEESPEQPVLLVSEMDPKAVLLRQSLLILLVVLGVLTVAGALTAVALTPPAFGTTSKIGALSLLIYFLLVQPLGVWLSERVLPPHRAIRGGEWVRARLPATLAVRPRSHKIFSDYF